MSTTRRGLIWEVLNSWWIILSFFGFPFLSFFYIGSKTKTKKWKITGLIYLIVYVISLVAMVIVPLGKISTIIVFIWLLILLAGFVHSLLSRKEYLMRRDYILSNGIEDKELQDMKKQIRKEYKGKDFIGSSGNDTHFDSTYHSNMGYRDYETVSNKPEKNPFEGENYDESIVKNNEDILDKSKYVSYSKKNKQTNNNTSNNNLININSCSVEELLQLPGVDEQIAQKAVSLREMMGGFNSVQEFIDMTHIDVQYVSQIREKSTISE